MAATVAQVMTGDPETVSADAPTGDAAGMMRAGIGDVTDGDWLIGINAAAPNALTSTDNYVPTVLDDRCEAFLYCDHTRRPRPPHPSEARTSNPRPTPPAKRG